MSHTLYAASKAAPYYNRNKQIFGLLIIILAIFLMPVTVYAEGEGSGGDASSIITSVLQIIGPGMSAMGALIAVLGGIKLGQSFSQENADGKTQGFQIMVGGLILAGVSTVITAVTLPSLTLSKAGADELLALVKACIQTVGSLVSVVGGIQLASSFTSENPDGKVRGFQTLVSGACITGLSTVITGFTIDWNVTATGDEGAIFIIPFIYSHISAFLG